MFMLGQSQSKQLKYYFTTIHTWAGIQKMGTSPANFSKLPIYSQIFGKYEPPLSSYAAELEGGGPLGSAIVEGHGLPPKPKISLAFLTKIRKIS
jgi:hypothetical protein